MKKTCPKKAASITCSLCRHPFLQMTLLVAILNLTLIACSKKELQARYHESTEQASEGPTPEPPDGDEEPPQVIVDPPPVPPDNEPPSDDQTPPPTDSHACYPSHLCLNTHPKETLGELKKNYDYPNPYTDPKFPATLNPDQYRKPHSFLDIKNIPLNENVSENFNLFEFLVLKKGPYGILSPLAVERLQFIRELARNPLHVNSAYRSPGYNAGISGSATFSRHMYGDAFDLTPSNISLQKLQQLCLQAGASYTKVYRTHVHCDWRQEDLHPAFFSPVPITKKVFSSYTEFLKKQSFISLTQNKKKKSLQAELILPELEEGTDKLLVMWKVTTPSGEIIEEEAMGIKKTFSVRESGLYTIEAHVGYSYKIYSQIKY